MNLKQLIRKTKQGKITFEEAICRAYLIGKQKGKEEVKK